MTDLPDELAGMSPEDVLRFLREATDAELLGRVHGIGTDRVLELLFTEWAQRFPADPRRQPGRLCFELDDDGTTHRHVLDLTTTGARHLDGAADRPRATLRTSLVRFLRVAAGAQDPKALVLTGRLRIGGDLLWAVGSLRGAQQR